jgi:hypothetical protein
VVVDPFVKHHQNALDAVRALEARIHAKRRWAAMVPPHVPDGKNPAAKAHGLEGPEWALMFQAFDQQFQKVLDRMAWLEREARGLRARVETLEIKEAVVRMRGARKSTRATLETGQVILESAVDALPGLKEIGAAVKELSGIFGGLIRE